MFHDVYSFLGDAAKVTVGAFIGAFMGHGLTKRRAVSDRHRDFRDVVNEIIGKLERQEGMEARAVHLTSVEFLRDAAAKIVEDIANQASFKAVLDDYSKLGDFDFAPLIGAGPEYRSGKSIAISLLKKLIEFSK